MTIIVERKVDNCGRVSLPRQALRNLGVNIGDEMIIAYKDNVFTITKKEEKEKEEK